MVATKILDEALRGGEPAKALEERCKARLENARKTVQDLISSAPVYVTESRKNHEQLVKESESLDTELEMLGASLDDVTNRSQILLERSQLEARKKEALDDLAVEIVPFVKVADALEKSDNLSEASFTHLQKTVSMLESTIAIATESGKSQLIHMIPELEERADAATAMMKSRFMDTFDIRSTQIIASGRPSQSTSFPHTDAATASAVLAKAGLLDEALSGIVSELVRNNVALGLSKATVFFEDKIDNKISLEWSEGADNAGELLEFDFDDLEDVPDEEIDAMTEHLDISNTAARALKVFDVLREKVIGEKYSRELALKMQYWFANHILPASLVMESNRMSLKRDGIPREALRQRVTAISAAARVVQKAMRTRGATSFVLVVSVDVLEQDIGSECRAQAVLSARQAIALFANARHDDNEMVECPIAATEYLPRDQRPPEYFAPCLVTRTAIKVHDVFLTTRKDAVVALQGGSMGIGEALNAAALECLRSYREDIPVQHADDLRASLRLKALYFTDCTMLAHSCRMSAMSIGSTPEMEEETNDLEAAANKAMMVVRRMAEQRLTENLTAACRNGALGAYGTLVRIQRGSALSAAFTAMREVVSIFSDVVPTELAKQAAGRLLQKYLTFLCSQVIALPEISADGCAQIDGVLRDADNNTSTLMEMVKGMEIVRAGAPAPEVIQKLRQSQRKLGFIREILNARMEDIATAFRSGKYEDLITRDEVERLLRAIFEDTPLRASFIADLDVSVEQENGEWENSNW